MPKALAIQINGQFAGGTGIMQVEHTADCFGGAWLKSPLSTEVWYSTYAQWHLLLTYLLICVCHYAARNHRSYMPLFIPLHSNKGQGLCSPIGWDRQLGLKDVPKGLLTSGDWSITKICNFLINLLYSSLMPSLICHYQTLASNANYLLICMVI